MSYSIQKLPGKAFLSFPEQYNDLLLECENRLKVNFLDSKRYGDVLYLPNIDSELEPYWARLVFREPFFITFDSIGDISKALKSIARLWTPYFYCCFRRGSFVQEKLPYISQKKRIFPCEIPSSPIGIYTLLDEHTALCSAKTSSFLPAGKIEFIEDHENPPSRAYLKLQESLCLAHHFFSVDFPSDSTNCFEAGACPGGWTWVLCGLGSHVFAVDRSPLAQSLMENPLVTFLSHDAFTLKPSEIGKCDWVFSDVICYPERLLKWVKEWLKSGLTKNMICTIKMQGAVQWDIVSEFAKIPYSRVVHLNYNKHELTFIHCNPSS